MVHSSGSRTMSNRRAEISDRQIWYVWREQLYTAQSKFFERCCAHSIVLLRVSNELRASATVRSPRHSGSFEVANLNRHKTARVIARMLSRLVVSIASKTSGNKWMLEPVKQRNLQLRRRGAVRIDVYALPRNGNCRVVHRERGAE